MNTRWSMTARPHTALASAGFSGIVSAVASIRHEATPPWDFRQVPSVRLETSPQQRTDLLLQGRSDDQVDPRSCNDSSANECASYPAASPILAAFHVIVVVPLRDRLRCVGCCRMPLLEIRLARLSRPMPQAMWSTSMFARSTLASAAAVSTGDILELYLPRGDQQSFSLERSTAVSRCASSDKRILHLQLLG